LDIPVKDIRLSRLFVPGFQPAKNPGKRREDYPPLSENSEDPGSKALKAGAFMICQQGWQSRQEQLFLFSILGTLSPPIFYDPNKNPVMHIIMWGEEHVWLF